MRKPIIFFHGGAGEENYAADAKLVESLQKSLGPGYTIQYPLLPEAPLPDFGRRQQIEHELALGTDPVILVAHSLGASMLLKCLSENKVSRPILGVFLMATPFWSGDEDWVKPLMLKSNFAETLPDNIPLFLYQCRDDEEVPFGTLAQYQQLLPASTARAIATGGHQFNNDLTVVANDIKTL